MAEIGKIKKDYKPELEELDANKEKYLKKKRQN